MPSVKEVITVFSRQNSFDTWSRASKTGNGAGVVGDGESQQSDPVRYVRDGVYDPRYNDPIQRRQERSLEAQTRRQVEAAMRDQSQGASSVDTPPDPYSRVKTFFNTYDAIETQRTESPSIKKKRSSKSPKSSSSVSSSSPSPLKSFSKSPKSSSSSSPPLKSSSQNDGSTLGEILDISLDGSVTHSIKEESVAPSIKEELSSGSRPLDEIMEDAVPTRKHSLSAQVRAAERQLMQSFHQHMARLSPSSVSSNNGDAHAAGDSSQPTVSTDDVLSDDQDGGDRNEVLALHDLCIEAETTEDLAWRNALYLLSMQPHLASVVDNSTNGWTPLHVCSMGDEPPPEFFVRALLLVHSPAASHRDHGGRLPLHILAATSGCPEIMQMLVEVNPVAVYQTDNKGMTPLTMYLNNTEVPFDIERLRILLGQTTRDSLGERRRTTTVRQRRGDHLGLNPDEIGHLQQRKSGATHLHGTGDIPMDRYPDDVQKCFKKLVQYKRRSGVASPPMSGNGGGVGRTGDESYAIELDIDVDQEETNPAAIASPLHQKLPLHLAVRRLAMDASTSAEIRRMRSADNDLRQIAPRPTEVVRVLIAAYPEALISRDDEGLTPLLEAFLNEESLPNGEIIDILLGKRSVGFESTSPPTWAEDLQVHKLLAPHTWRQQNPCINPAMLPTLDSHELPLHLAAEEMSSDRNVIKSIYDCYRGATSVQDIRGRTPLHTLLQNYRGITPEPEVIDLLVNDQVVGIRDNDGKLPLDLLIQCADRLPSNEPKTEFSQVYERFFHSSVLSNRDRLRGQGLVFLLRLTSLPPWLRKHAFRAPFVQDVLLDEVARPGRTAIVMFNFLMLVVLIFCFRMNIDDLRRDDFVGNSLTGYGLIAGVSSGYLIFYQLLLWNTTATLGVFTSQVAANIWAYIDMAAPCLAMASSLMMGSTSIETLSQLGTAGTGLLWLSLISFIAQWWEGMAIFACGVLNLSRILFWPLVAVTVLVISYAQMFLTLSVSSDQECTTVLGGRPLCNIRDAYKTVYMLLLWTPLLENDSDSLMEEADRLEVGFIALISSFTILLVLVIINLIVSVAGQVSRLSGAHLAGRGYWEPKLTFIIVFLAIFPCVTKKSWEPLSKGEHQGRRERDESYPLRLERAWQILTEPFSSASNRPYNGGQSNWISSSVSWLVAVILVPIWFVGGLVTLGLMWPQSIRRWLFSRTAVDGHEYRLLKKEIQDAAELRAMRGEVAAMKAMTFQKTQDVHDEIRELKQVLLMAMQEDEPR